MYLLRFQQLMVISSSPSRYTYLAHIVHVILFFFFYNFSVSLQIYGAVLFISYISYIYNFNFIQQVDVVLCCNFCRGFFLGFFCIWCGSVIPRVFWYSVHSWIMCWIIKSIWHLLQTGGGSLLIRNWWVKKKSSILLFVMAMTSRRLVKCRRMCLFLVLLLTLFVSTFNFLMCI